MKTLFRIRHATYEDLPAIIKISVDSWRTSYKGIIDQTYLDNISYERRLEHSQKNFHSNPITRLVAELYDVGIVAFADGGPAREAAYKDHGEIYAIYSQEKFKGQGIGRVLFQAIRRKLFEQGFQKQYLWVLENNPTTKFYKKAGGLPEIKRDRKIGDQILSEVIMKWREFKYDSIFHLTTKSAWGEAATKGEYTHQSFSREGFIHFSEEHQLGRIAESFYKDVKDLVTLEVDLNNSNLNFKFELSPTEEFPHLYQTLPTHLVKNVRIFS